MLKACWPPRLETTIGRSVESGKVFHAPRMKVGHKCGSAEGLPGYHRNGSRVVVDRTHNRIGYLARRGYCFTLIDLCQHDAALAL